MASQAAVLSILIKANTSQATTGILRVNQQLGATEKSAGRAERSTNKALSSMARGADKTAAAFEAVSKALVIGGGVAVAAGLAFSVKKAAEFEQQISSLGSVADASGKQMERFRKQALKAGADTKFSALEAAQAQTELAKGGLTVRQIMRGGLRSALALASAGEMELADAATATVNAMKLFGLRGKDAMKVADQFATAANRTTADVKDFAMALSQGGSAAKAAGLTFTETVAALEALAEVGIKNSDAGTSLKTALLHLASPTEKSFNLMKSLGLSFFKANGEMKSLVSISAMLRDKMGGLTREQRLQAATTMVGTDGMRALLALYDAGPKKIRGFETGLKKQGTAAEVAKRKQDNLKGSLEQLGGSVETLGIQIGSELLPFIRKGTDGLTDFANKVGRIFARDDLSFGEKFQKAFALAKVTAKPLIDKLVAEIDHANIPEKIAAAVSAATPLILKGMAFAGITAAKTFVGAFADSDVWGKLALGTFLIRKLGLGGLLTGGLGKGGAGGGLGGAASMAKPVPVFVTNPGGVGGGGGPGVVGGVGGAGGKVKGVLKGAGKLGGRLAALDLVINLVDQSGNPIAAAINTAHDLTFGIVPKVNVKTGGEKQDVQIGGLEKQLDAAVKGRDLGGIKELVSKVHTLAKESRDFGNSKLGARFDELGTKGAAAAGKLSRQLSDLANKHRDVAAMSDRFAAAIKGLRLKGSKDFDGLVSHVTFGAQQILRVGGGKSKQTREEISRQFGLARKRVRQAMDDQVLSVKQGSQLMHDLAVKQLALYGIKAGRVNVVLAKGANGQMRPNQRGGYQLGGKPTGDSIPSLLERGEYVVNRKAVAKVGRKALDNLNFGSAPRFQKGGPVGMQSGGSVTGDTDFLPAVMTALQRMSAAAGVPIFVQSGRRTVAEQLAQGPSTPGHPVAGPNGPHVRGVAADITPGFGAFGKIASRFGLGFTVMPQEPWHIQLLKGMGAAGAAAFAGLGKAQIMGPSSAGLEAAQGALDRIRSAANASVAAVAGSTANGSEAGFAGSGVGGGTGADLMKAISKARGWSFGDWWALDGSETGHGRNLSNPTSSARLRGQFLDSNWGKYGPGSDPRQNPSMAQQIQSMAQYIAERYGNPSTAWAFHRAHNYYATGGVVGFQPGGSVGPNTASGTGDTSHPGTANPHHGKTTLASTLHKVRHSHSPKVRKAAVDKMLDKIKKLGLPKSMSSDLAKYSGDANTFGDFANRAEALTVTPDDGSDPVQGVVNGKTQAEWLKAQLDALFQWRNAIIRAEKVVVDRREKTAKLIERARARLTTVRHDIAVANHTLKGPKGLEKQLAKLQKHPKRNKAQITKVKGLIKDLNRDQRGRGRVRDSLKDRILPALTGRRSSLNGLRGDLLSNLDTVQGPGSPMKVLATLPPDGVLGGQIFDVQMTLRDLNAPKAKITDSTTDAGPDQSALMQLLTEANKRTAVSEAQYKVFDDVKNMQQFATGGIVQGPTGAAVPAVVHAGEGVFTRDQMAAIGGAGTPVVHVHVADGMSWLKKFIRVEVEGTTRAQARGARTLPGRPGGLR